MRPLSTWRLREGEQAENVERAVALHLTANRGFIRSMDPQEETLS